MKTTGIGKYHSILMECYIEGLFSERYIFFDHDLNRLFIELSSSLTNLVSVFIDQHSDYFSNSEISDFCDEYSDLKTSHEEWSYVNLMKILNYILDKGKLTFTSPADNGSFLSELDSFLSWLSNIPSFPYNDYVEISIHGEYPGFIEQWYRYETSEPMLPFHSRMGIEQSSYDDEDATLIGWLNILLNSPGWHEKPDAVKFVGELVGRFNDRFELGPWGPP